ncbi:MAG: MFS transporter [Balneolales bacterium]
MLAVLAGVLARSVPEGPYLKRGKGLRFAGVFRAFRVPRFRASAMGYFGHMWELYAFWAFIPVWLAAYGLTGPALSLASFSVIALGAAGCAGGGFLVRRFGSGRIALSQLSVSALCCLLSPLLLAAPPLLFALFLGLWGLCVVGDSPQFSALNARHAPKKMVGSALTLANCLGFSVSIGSLALLDWLQLWIDPSWLLFVLFPGPLLGLLAARPLWQREAGD